MDTIANQVDTTKHALLKAGEVAPSVAQHAKAELSQAMVTYTHWVDMLKTWMVNNGVGNFYADVFKILIVFATITILALLANYITKRIILTIVYRIAKKTETILDDILVEKKVFHRLAHFAPAIVVYYSITLPLDGFPRLLLFMQDITQVYMIVVGLMTLLAVVDSLQEMYLTLEVSKIRSIKGYLQVAKILLYILSGVFIISALNDTSPASLLTGIGAMAAVLMFVFKDTIMGLVASIQLSANDMLRPGDWIEMPSRKADGLVQDISLTTIKVQNWDKTITTIPTYSLVTDSFTNWRGMEESEGRRIRKAIYIDMRSMKFYSDSMLDKLANNPIVAKNFDVRKYIAETQGSEKPEHRTLTNLGVFRAYLGVYLNNLPEIHSSMTLLVRYLQSTENGLPLEITVFSKEKSGNAYEKVQCDIIDHILAILPEFELSVFQRPSRFGPDEQN
jgi:miniconductance mechanosensitive channel